jgi:hypothetical protein
MKTRKFLSIAFFALVFGATSSKKTVMVGGAAMYPLKILLKMLNSKRSYNFSSSSNSSWI